jgi:signal transduction histidine kinase
LRHASGRCSRELDAAAPLRENHAMDIREVLRREDDERRALERLLHDGAQQHLIALTMTLQLAEQALVHDATAAAERIAEARTLAAELVDELREAAQRVHSPLLDQHGLLAALRSVADVQGRLHDPVPTEVGVTVYRLCAAAEGAVGLRVVDDALELDLHGDVSGLEPRVRALGGTLDQTAGRVRARLPLRPPLDT